MADITEFPIPTAPLDPEFQTNATHVQWRLTPTDPWVDLVLLSELEGPQGDTGPAGSDGSDGREVELQTNATHVQWRYVGEVAWNDLILLSALQGPEGPQGPTGASGGDGREVELQTTATHIQWRYVGEATWNDLILLSALEGPQGPQGPQGADGPAIELQVTATHIEWRVVGDLTWLNLIALSELTGPQGPAGADGADGEDATPGLVPHVVVSASKTLLLSDANSEQQVDAAATLTIPTNALVAYARGTKIAVLSLTAGTVTIDASGGVTLNGTDGGAADLSAQYSGAVITKVGTDAWVLSGDTSGVA